VNAPESPASEVSKSPPPAHPTSMTVAIAANVRFMATTVIHISGMSCQNCVKHVTDALLGVPGVDSVDVSLEAGTATVYSDETIVHDAMRSAVGAAGYEVTA